MNSTSQIDIKDPFSRPSFRIPVKKPYIEPTSGPFLETPSGASFDDPYIGPMSETSIWDQYNAFMCRNPVKHS